MRTINKAPINPNRRKFMFCAALTGLSSLTVKATDNDDSSIHIETAIEAALEKERNKAFDRSIKKQAQLVRPLVDKFGDNALETIKQDTIQRISNRYKARKIEKRDLDAIKELLWDNLANDKNFQFELIKNSSTELSFKVTKCKWAEAWNKVESGDIGYAATCSWDYGFCEGINPEIEFKRTKTLMQGDCCCNHSYKL